jgi:hypothetical protein
MKMDDPGWLIRSLVLRLFEGLLTLYPPRFRGEFSAEIRGSLAACAKQRTTGSVVSLLFKKSGACISDPANAGTSQLEGETMPGRSTQRMEG